MLSQFGFHPSNLIGLDEVNFPIHLLWMIFPWLAMLFFFLFLGLVVARRILLFDWVSFIQHGFLLSRLDPIFPGELHSSTSFVWISSFRVISIPARYDQARPCMGARARPAKKVSSNLIGSNLPNELTPNTKTFVFPGLPASARILVFQNPIENYTLSFTPKPNSKSTSFVPRTNPTDRAVTPIALP